MKTTDKSYSAPELVVVGSVVARTLGAAELNKTEADPSGVLPFYPKAAV
jgi:hypothetical protein